jgi:hypothetical protein
MRYADCEIGMIVTDTRTGIGYKVIGERLHASDNGAWVEELEVSSDGVKEVWVTHWSHLEPRE